MSRPNVERNAEQLPDGPSPMNGGQTRRFPRTARAMPDAGPKIERDKIKHRQPNDLMFEDTEPPVTRRSLLTDDDDQVVDGGDLYDLDTDDWTVEPEDSTDVQAWDEESGDDWVLDGEGGSDAGAFEEEGDGYVEDESGIVWTDDAFSDQDSGDSPDDLAFEPDELAFEREAKEFGFAPEVELAAKRDVRPRRPRPAPEHRPQTRRQPQRTPTPRRRESGDWAEPGEQQVSASDKVDISLTPRQRAERAAEASSLESDQYSRTRATLGAADPAFGARADEEVLQQPMRGRRSRRRKAQSAPAVANMPKRDRYGVIRPGRGRGFKVLIAVTVLAMLSAGGWFVYQSLGPEGIRPMIDRLTALVPVPSSTRKAADTSFGNPRTTDEASPEQAIAELELRIRQQSGGEAAVEEALPAVDPATTRVDGPPIPKFKPLVGETRSLSSEAPAPTPTAEEAQLAANGGDGQAAEPSIFEQLWRYFSPG